MSTSVICRTVVINPAAFLLGAAISAIKKTFSIVFYMFLIISVTFLTGFYLIQIKSQAWERNTVIEKESELEKIMQGNKSIEISEKNNKSLDDVLTLAEDLNFIEAGKINYITISNGGQVVIK